MRALPSPALYWRYNIVKKKTVRALLLLFICVFTVASISLTSWAESGGGAITATPAASDTPASAPASETDTPSKEEIQSEAPTQSEKAPTSREESTAEESTHSERAESEKTVSREASRSENRPASRTSSKKEYVDPDDVVSSGKASIAERPNTYESHINQNAEAVASASPNANSENWDDLLSGVSSTASVVSSTTVSMATGGAGTLTSGKSGGTSSLFLIGVGLIAAAVCGIGAFIYLQFFSRKHRGGGASPRDDDTFEDGEGFAYTTTELDRMASDSRGQTGGNPAAHAATATVIPHRMPEVMQDDTIDTFTDINSSSDGIQHREEYEEFVERTKPPIVPKPATRTAPPVYKPAKPDAETLTLPELAPDEAAQRARQSQAARVQSRRRQPPLTSNAVPRNLRGRPTAAQTPAERTPASRPARPVVPRQATAPQPEHPVQKPAQSAASHKSLRGDNFDWDKFLNDNRHD